MNEDVNLIKQYDVIQKTHSDFKDDFSKILHIKSVNDKEKLNYLSDVFNVISKQAKEDWIEVELSHDIIKYLEEIIVNLGGNIHEIRNQYGLTLKERNENMYILKTKI